MAKDTDFGKRINIVNWPPPHGSSVVIVSFNTKRMRVKADNPWEALHWLPSRLSKFPDGSQAREEGLRFTPGSGGAVHHNQEGTAV